MWVISMFKWQRLYLLRTSQSGYLTVILESILDNFSRDEIEIISHDVIEIWNIKGKKLEFQVIHIHITDLLYFNVLID
jgi:hypothetical protein